LKIFRHDGQSLRWQSVDADHSIFLTREPQKSLSGLLPGELLGLCSPPGFCINDLSQTEKESSLMLGELNLNRPAETL
jgi:hypothetical protein